MPMDPALRLSPTFPGFRVSSSARHPGEFRRPGGQVEARTGCPVRADALGNIDALRRPDLLQIANVLADAILWASAYSVMSCIVSTYPSLSQPAPDRPAQRTLPRVEVG